MKRLLLNGSPRGKESNSRLLLSWIAEGMASAGTERDIPILDLARTSDVKDQAKAFLEAEEVVLAFPLYTDSMPGIVKNFVESLSGADPARLKGKRFAFIVQSGFMESIHSETVAAYFIRLCSRLGMSCAGAVIKGGVEGVRFMPDSMTAKLKEKLIRAGKELVQDGRVSRDLIQSMARPRRLGPAALLLSLIVTLTGMSNYYWNLMLKKHGAYEKRFDAPYGEKATVP